MGTGAVRVISARKTYGRGAEAHAVLDGLDLDVDDGEVVVVLGPSGSGKSTLLRTLAGLESLDAGKIEGLDERGAIGVAFQQPLLLPWLTTRANVSLGGRFRANR